MTDTAAIAVDVVVDNYNYGRFVADAIESALAQSHSNVAVIVVDDGSTDESREVLRRYEGLVQLVLKENGGQASALNAGFARSRGEVVIFLDADDILAPDAAALVAAAFTSRPEVVKLQYLLEVIDGDGRRTGIVKPPRTAGLPQGDVREAELSFPFDLTWLAPAACAYRAQPLRTIMPIPEKEFARCPDWYLAHLSALLGPVASLDVVAAYYRVHGSNRYEPQHPTLDLDHVRDTIVFADATANALVEAAAALQLELPNRRLLSVSDLAHRLISLKLEPDRHPLAGDRLRTVTVDGVSAALKRFDVSLPLRLLFAGWFAVAVVLPPVLLRPLAEVFLFPARRERVNRLLAHFQRGRVAAG